MQKLIEDGGIMTGNGRLGVQRIPASKAIPKQSKAETRTSNGITHTAAKKMKKVMKHVMKGC